MLPSWIIPADLPDREYFEGKAKLADRAEVQVTFQANWIYTERGTWGGIWLYAELEK